ncbi:integrase catalytic domain-containing protein [Nephila pilipes]|uniref:Integrase catalytic domain-containing protein n=1 Tax=Nephila pilipes TaxID=299642 RepID=A0A8X6QFZ7_NEPPI|nr:integrase catalytic domain-containing protein [Nephila pilipes]
MGQPPVTIQCDVSTDRIRSFVPKLLEGFHYCLTCVDWFPKWPEAFPLVDISAEVVVKVFYTGWFARFRPPLSSITDQGTQFESSLFDALSKLLSTERSSTQLHMIRPFAAELRGFIGN